MDTLFVSNDFYFIAERRIYTLRTIEFSASLNEFCSKNFRISTLDEINWEGLQRLMTKSLLLSRAYIEAREVLD